MIRPLVIGVAVFVPMLIENSYSRRNDRALRRRGAIEPPGDVYRAMRIAYPACFLGMIAEGWLRAAPAPGAAAAGAALFVAAKILKYWAIRSLGLRWTFRVLVPPGDRRVVTGPYRWLRHPNYVAVAGEMAGVAVMAPAPLTGAAAILFFGGLMAARIRIEERALDAGA